MNKIHFFQTYFHNKKAVFLLFFFILIVFSSLFLHQQNLINVSKKKAALAEIQRKKNLQLESVGLPVRIKIPKMYIDANIQQLGLTKEGAMDVPTNSVDTGWFNLGPRPGEIGSAVIDGHLDAKNGAPGVFYNLNELIPGDKLYIEDQNGKSIAFMVRESRTYDPKDDVPDVFNQTDGKHLNLITCDGAWDKGERSYSKRLVVFTDRVK
ncbi:MAG: class F sortase [Patescibacteria group bacterium]